MDPVTLILMQGAAAGLNALGSFYDAKTQQYGLQSRAVQAEYQASTSSINARQAELDAQRILQAGRRRQGVLGLQAAQVAGATRAQAGAAGIEAGVGSAVETAASNRLAYEIDTREVNLATVGAAAAARTEAQNQRNQSLFSLTESAAFRRAASKINPRLIALRSFAGSTSRIGSQWYPYFAGGGS